MGQPVAYRDTVVLLLFERDGNFCSHCGKRLDIEANFRTSRYVTVDHITPKSQGGTNQLSNLRLLHLGCNSRLGAQGHPVSLETRKRISDAHKKRLLDKSRREAHNLQLSRMQASWRGRKHSMATREKMSKSALHRWHGE